jgi:hypothetical protein
MISRVQKGEQLYEEQDIFLSEYKLALEACTPADRKIVFTHVNPGLKNIILRCTHNRPPDWEVTLINWAGAGWFPAWVQGASCAQRFGIWDKSGNVHVHLAKEFVAIVYGDMECGSELVRICTQARRKVRQEFTRKKCVSKWILNKEMLDEAARIVHLSNFRTRKHGNVCFGFAPGVRARREGIERCGAPHYLHFAY